MAKIITSYIFPPIPMRCWDWVACREDDEEGYRGWGETELDAIKDLIKHEGDS